MGPAYATKTAVLRQNEISKIADHPRAIGWLRIVRSGFGDEAQGFGAVVSVVEEGLVE
jgi:hypothetical protein